MKGVFRGPSQLEKIHLDGVKSVAFKSQFLRFSNTAFTSPELILKTQRNSKAPIQWKRTLFEIPGGLSSVHARSFDESSIGSD